MKKLLLLSAFCVFAQVRTEESKFPEMTDKQKSELEGIKNIMPKYVQAKDLRALYAKWFSKNMAQGLGYSTTDTNQTNSLSILNGNSQLEITFKDGEFDSYKALKRMLKEDCQNTNMLTGELNPSIVKACTALRDMFKATQSMDNDDDYQTLNVIVNRQ